MPRTEGSGHAGSLVVRETIFEQNTAMFGGALFNHGGDIHIEDSTFVGGRAAAAATPPAGSLHRAAVAAA